MRLPRLTCFLLLLAFLLPAQAQAPQAGTIPIVARAWVLIDVSSGQVLSAEKPDERFEPASLTKLMTAYLVFTAIRERKIALDQQVNVSERA